MKRTTTALIGLATAITVVRCVGGPSDPAVRHRLLDLASSAVEKMPADPHFKNKARIQYELVGCALDLGEAGWAEAYADQGLYWQRGASFADIALHCARAGDAPAAEKNLSKAEEWFKANEPAFKAKETEQEWRLNRVKTKIILAGAALGREGVEKQYGMGLGLADLSQLVRQKAMSGAKDDCAAAMEQLNALAGSGEFDAVNASMEGWVELYGLHYGDETLRRTIREQIGQYCTNTPFVVQIGLFTRLGEAALAHGGSVEALADADVAAQLLEKRQNPPRFRIPLAANIAALRYRAGEEGPGLEALSGCMDLFDEQSRLILNIDQAGILCSVAEAYQKIGETGKALELYDRAITAGQINPNSRPRTEDISRICCSMARSGIDPTDMIFQRLGKMNNDLGTPW